MRLRIQGGLPLVGEYRPAGNTNAAVALLAASLLGRAPVQLENLPRTTSTNAMLETAASLGASIEWQGENGALTAHIQGGTWSTDTLPKAANARYAGTLLLLAPLLCAHERIHIELDVPLRRIRAHLAAMRALGLVEAAEGGQVLLRRQPWGQRALVLAERVLRLPR